MKKEKNPGEKGWKCPTCGYNCLNRKEKVMPEIGREKEWAELTDSEKIERMRQQVKWWQGRVMRLEAKVSKLYEHEHHDGKLTRPLKEYENNSDGCEKVSSIREMF